ncbi:MAG: flagellin [Planctomycetota bacterium]
MSSFIPGISRVPDFLVNRQSLNAITSANAELFGVQNELATGRALIRPSQDPVRAAAVAELNENLARSDQRLRNFDTSEGALNVLDSALAESTSLAQEALSLALSQISSGSDATERAAQATVVESYLESIFRISNSESLVGYIFGGTQPGRAPIEEFNGAYRFVGGVGEGLTPDLAVGRSIPVTLGAGNAVGAVSGRVEGFVDLNPALTDDTRLADLNGARSLGVTGGTVEIDIGAAEPLSVDLTKADTIGDVVDLLEAAIREYETLNSTTILGPSGITLNGEALQIDAAVPIEFSDITGSETARDLGLVQDPPTEFAAGVSLGVDLGPKATLRTPVSALQGLTGALGSIRISNNGVTRDVDLSGAQSLGDIKSLIEATNLGVQVSINDAGTGLNIVSELSTTSDNALSISEVGDGTRTATALGIRSFSRETKIEDLNFGRGVEVLEGGASPDLDVDFEIVIAGPTETRVPINLSPSDLGTVEDVIDAINADIAAAGITTVTANLSDDANGIGFNYTGPNGPVSVAQRNNSPAADQLGLLDGSWDVTNNRWQGEDVGTVRVESMFTHLLDLRDSLLNNDEFGMQLAADGLQVAADELAESRALVGGFARRVSSERAREEERNAVDTQVRSTLQDADFAEAATRFSQLQVQLEAGLQVAAISRQLTLLDFLG